jgi:hypothetical protein
MLRRMMIVALLLGVPSAFADGIAVTPTVGVAATQPNAMLNATASARVAARLSGQYLYKSLLFSKSTKVPQPAEEGDITF